MLPHLCILLNEHIHFIVTFKILIYSKKITLAVDKECTIHISTLTQWCTLAKYSTVWSVIEKISMNFI